MADEKHRPVMLDEVLKILDPGSGKIYVDGTVGAGGHAERILALSQPEGKLIGLDRDPSALAIAAERLAPFGGRVALAHANFTELRRVLDEHGIRKVHGIIFDLGLSSMQIADAARGFSFQNPDAPLDMRAGGTTGETAAQKIALAGEKEIADALWRLADERFSRRIAREIVRVRRREQIRTVGQLAKIVERAYGGGWQKIHPATRTFMALRMWVNSELENLEETLAALPEIIEPGGRAAIISFHSKEDRIVKNVLRDQARDGIWRILTKKPVTASEDEVNENPRARSAKLRAAERTDK